MLNLDDKINYLIDNGVNVLVYSGDKDFICNWRGGEAWTNNLNWKHKAEFQKKDYTPWSY